MFVFPDDQILLRGCLSSKARHAQRTSVHETGFMHRGHQCMKLVSCSKLCPNSFFLIRTANVWDSHCGEVICNIFPGCDAVLTDSEKILHPSSWLNIAAFLTKLKLWETVAIIFVLHKLWNNRFVWLCVWLAICKSNILDLTSASQTEGRVTPGNRKAKVRDPINT
jgi:hypothetical protein